MRLPYVVQFLACLLLLIAGFMMGVAVDNDYRPNHIIFGIQPSTKINLLPREGDVLDWVDSQNHPTNPLFASNPALFPCEKGTAASRCIVKAPGTYDKAVYPYTCKGCFDPALGPVSKKQPGGGTVPISAPPLKFWPVFTGDLQQLLNISSTPESQAGSSWPITNVLPENGIPVQPALACDGGMVHVYPVGAATDSTIKMKPADILYFTGVIPYSSTEPVTSNGDKLCTNGDIPSPELACTVSPTAIGSYTYVIKSNACSPSQTETIQVP